MPWLRQLAAGLTLKRTGFDPKRVRRELGGQIYLRVLRLLHMLLSVHQCYVLIFNLSTTQAAGDSQLRASEIIISLSKSLYYPTNAYNVKNADLLKHIKIMETAPTCFGLQGNHHQGATATANT